jgi:hypothetical protein
LTRKIHFQSACSISQPPEIGPIATPRPATAAQTAIAFGRSSGGKMFEITERVVGMIPAAPRPIRAREAISSAEPLERAARIEPAPKIERPTTSARRRPKRSPSEPAVSSIPANTSR